MWSVETTSSSFYRKPPQHTATCYWANVCVRKQVTWLVVTEARSASFGLVLHGQHIFANSFHFLVTWGLSVTVFYSTCIFCVYGIALYWPTLQFYLCVYVSFVCRYVASLVSVITTFYDVAKSIFIVEHGMARFLCAMHVFEVWASSSTSRLPLCQISFLLRPSLLSYIADGEKSVTQSINHSLTHTPYLMPQQPKLAPRKILNWMYYTARTSKRFHNQLYWGCIQGQTAACTKIR